MINLNERISGFESILLKIPICYKISHNFGWYHGYPSKPVTLRANFGTGSDQNFNDFWN